MRVGAPAALAYKRAPPPNTRAAYRLAILPHAVNLGSLYPEKKSASVGREWSPCTPDADQETYNALLDTSPVNYGTGKTPPRKKCQRGRRLSRAPCGAPRLNVALARLVDLKAALLLLAEARARGPDGSRMRSPQLARCSRDQLRRRMGQHGAALARGRGGGCEVFRAPPSLGRQLEARQRAGIIANSTTP